MCFCIWELNESLAVCTWNWEREKKMLDSWANVACVSLPMVSYIPTKINKYGLFTLNHDFHSSQWFFFFLLLDIFLPYCICVAVIGGRHSWSTKIRPSALATNIWALFYENSKFQNYLFKCQAPGCWCGTTNPIVIWLLNISNKPSKTLFSLSTECLIRGRGNFFLFYLCAHRSFSTNVLIEYYRQANNKKKQRDFFFLYLFVVFGARLPCFTFLISCTQSQGLSAVLLFARWW